MSCNKSKANKQWNLDSARKELWRCNLWTSLLPLVFLELAYGKISPNYEGDFPPVWQKNPEENVSRDLQSSNNTPTSCSFLRVSLFLSVSATPLSTHAEILSRGLTTSSCKEGMLAALLIKSSICVTLSSCKALTLSLSTHANKWKILQWCVKKLNSCFSPILRKTP